jgi:hypothetical protein
MPFPTQPADPTQAQVNNALPQEYQDQIDQYRRRQIMAQRLMAQNQLQAPVRGQLRLGFPHSRHYLRWADKIGGQYLDTSAQQGIRDTEKKYATDEAADYRALTDAPADQQVNMGRNSKFARSRALAESLQKRQDEINKEKVGIYKDQAQGDQAMLC